MDSKEQSKSKKTAHIRKTHIYSFGPKNTLQTTENTTNKRHKIDGTIGRIQDSSLESSASASKTISNSLASATLPQDSTSKRRKVQSEFESKDDERDVDVRDPNSSEVFWNYSPERKVAHRNESFLIKPDSQTHNFSTPSHERLINGAGSHFENNQSEVTINTTSKTTVIDKKYGSILNLRNIIADASSSPGEEDVGLAQNGRSSHHIADLQDTRKLIVNTEYDSFEKDIDDIIDGLQSSICKDNSSALPEQDPSLNASSTVQSSPVHSRKPSQHLLRSSPLKSEHVITEELQFTQKYGQQAFDMLDEDEWSANLSNSNVNKSCNQISILKSDPVFGPAVVDYSAVAQKKEQEESRHKKSGFNTSIILQNKFDVEEDEEDESFLQDIEDLMTVKKGNVFTNSSKQAPQNITKILNRSRTFPLSKDEKVYTVKPHYTELAKYSSIPGKNNKELSGYKWFKRLVILGCENLELLDARERKTLLVCCDDRGEIYEVSLQGLWRVNCEYEPGQVIHLVEFESNTFQNMMIDRFFTLDDLSRILLILNPDTLLTATVVGTSMDCMRRTVINETFSLPGEPSLVMLRGIIVHELFQELLVLKSFDRNNDKLIDDVLDNLMSNNKKELIICGCDDFGGFKDEIKEKHVPYIKEFIVKYCQSTGDSGMVRVSGSSKEEKLKIEDVIEIEEKIWSPVLGIRGVLDGHLRLNGGSTVPFEIKSGKRSSNSHIAQSSLYTLLLQDRYDRTCEEFLLCYVEGKDVVKHYINILHLKHLIHYRNRLSNFLADKVEHVEAGELIELPPVLEYGSEICERCYCNRECTVLNYFEQREQQEKSSLNTKIKDVLLPRDYIKSIINKLSESPKDFQFYKKYMNLIDLEETSISFLNKEMFTMNSDERRKKTGKSLGHLKITKVERIRDVVNKFKLSFQFDHTDISEYDFKICKGDYVIINDEFGHFNLSSATVDSLNIEKKSISCITGLDIRKLNSFKDPREVLYRIDKNDTGLGMSLSRYNILGLFLPEREHLKQLVVHGEVPRFESSDQHVLDTSMIEWDKFNEDQQFAIKSALECQDYSLILGMPGTGKTTVIIEILKCLILGNNKKVLVSSYTHSAVDNILIKLSEEMSEKSREGFKVLRIGRMNKLHNDTKKYSPYFNDDIEDDIDDGNRCDKMMQSILDSNLVAVTCLGIQDWSLSSYFSGDSGQGDDPQKRQLFDYCILDEASQVSLPIALGPLHICDKFILVGDHFQLPPLIINEKAKEKGLDISLFKKLNDFHPNIVKKLTYQYRMNKDIMKLSNELIYDGDLKCGGSNVDNELPRYNSDLCIGSIDEVILNNQKKVCFINYDSLNDSSLIKYFKEIRKNEDIKNYGEMSLIKKIILPNLLKIIKSDDIGIMSLYRGQLNFLSKEISTLSSSLSDLEILTADQYQGRDKDCIIISFVRNNYDSNDSNVDTKAVPHYKILNDMERLNVAITRSKCKLIMVGSIHTLNTVPNLKPFVDLLEKEQWIYDLKDSDFPPGIIVDAPIPEDGNTTDKTRNKSKTSTLSSSKKKAFLNNILAEDS